MCCRLSSLAIWTSVLDPANVTALFNYGLADVPYLANATAFLQSALSADVTSPQAAPAAPAAAPATVPAAVPAAVPGTVSPGGHCETVQCSTQRQLPLTALLADLTPPQTAPVAAPSATLLPAVPAVIPVAAPPGRHYHID